MTIQSKDQNRGKMTVAEAGKKGGEKVAEERGSAFYSQIGRKGGETVSRDRKHMAEIGRKGGEAHHERRGAHGSDKIKAGNPSQQTNVDEMEKKSA